MFHEGSVKRPEMPMDHGDKDGSDQEPNQDIEDNPDLEHRRLFQAGKNREGNNAVLKRKNARDLRERAFTVDNQEKGYEHRRKRERQQGVMGRNDVCERREYLRMGNESECGKDEKRERHIEIGVCRKRQIVPLDKPGKEHGCQNDLHGQRCQHDKEQEHAPRLKERIEQYQRDSGRLDAIYDYGLRVLLYEMQKNDGQEYRPQ